MDMKVCFHDLAAEAKHDWGPHMGSEVQPLSNGSVPLPFLTDIGHVAMSTIQGAKMYMLILIRTKQREELWI